MMRKVILRDVMNSKATNHFRHSVNAYDIGKLSHFYAIESRIFNGEWNEELGKHVRGKHWFTNLMIFDFDFDESHFPTVDDYSKKLNESLNALFNILGTPKYIIKNKDPKTFSKYQMDMYFLNFKRDADGKAIPGTESYNTPKQYGCQVVYELSDSIQSQYLESVRLYETLRYLISKEVDADLNFKGHMFKNPYNRYIFDIEEFKDYDALDPFKFAMESKKFGDLLLNHASYDNIKHGGSIETLVDLIKSMKPFEALERNGSKSALPKHLAKWNYALVNFYRGLNSWNGLINNENQTIETVGNWKKSESRNVTLFNFLRSLPMKDLERITYESIINLNLFSHCDIKEDMDASEFQITKDSVLSYRMENPIAEDLTIKCNQQSEGIDCRVFKVDQQPMHDNFGMEMNEKLHIPMHGTRISTEWLGNNIDIDLYDVDESICKSDGNAWLHERAKALANAFCTNPCVPLFNISSLITQSALDWIKCNFALNDAGLYDLFAIVKEAVFLTHFKYYHSIQSYRKSKAKCKGRMPLTKTAIRNAMIGKYGMDERINYLKFIPYYETLKREGLLRENGNPFAISFYQSHFHINNTLATLYVRKIKKCVALMKAIKLIKHREQIRQNAHRSFIAFINAKSGVQKNTSKCNIHIINCFTIYNCIYYSTINCINKIYCKLNSINKCIGKCYGINYNLFNNKDDTINYYHSYDGKSICTLGKTLKLLLYGDGLCNSM